MFSRLIALHTKELVPNMAPKVSYRKALPSIHCCRLFPSMTPKRAIFSMINRPKIDMKLGHIGSNMPCFDIIARGTKTKKAAAKRFIVKGNGDLKYGRAGKRHNTSKKTKNVKRRLNQKVCDITR